MSKYRITDKYVIFWGSEFSNFYPCKIIVSGNEFSSSEQLFMYKKAELFQDKEMMEAILQAKTPREAKHFGRMVKGFTTDCWDKHKRYLMSESIFQKFSQNRHLKELLLDSRFDDKHFVEGSPYDRIWGIGIDWRSEEAENESAWKGQNLLGKSLDEVRRVLKR